MNNFFIGLWLVTIVGVIYSGINMFRKKMSRKVFFIILAVSLVSFIGSVVTTPPVEKDYNKVNNEVTEDFGNEDIEKVSEITNELDDKKNTSNVEINDMLETSEQVVKQNISLSGIPKYNGKAYIVINDNVPFFNEFDLTTSSFEKYSDLDSLGRCGIAVANIGKDLMPTDSRESIGAIKPTGWYTVKYNGIDGNYLYNRCHLIGFQLSGENANEKNLITGTRYMNVDGMLPFENMVADYVKETNNHVLYRVTPMFEGDNLLASGVLIEAKSVEDNGAGILFNVYCYNVQPGIEIDYKTGNSSGPEYTGTTSTTNTSTSNTSNNVSTSVSSSSNKNTSSSTSSSNTESNTSTQNTSNNASTNSSSGSSAGNSGMASSTSNSTTSNSSVSNNTSKPSSSNTTANSSTSTGSSSTTSNSSGTTTTNPSIQTYILNTNTKKFHEVSCGSGANIKPENRSTYTGTRDEIIAKGYKPCGNCDP